MKIGIDISQIVYKGTGVGRFTEGLVNTILKYDKNNQWFFFFSSFRQKLDNQLVKQIKEKDHQLIKWKLPPTLLSFLWNDLHKISKLFTFNFSLLTDMDWFITSDWTEPPMPKNVKKATIVHDLVYLRYPETVAKKILITQKKRLYWVKQESKIIFADSYATKNDLINFLKINEKRVIVNYPGVEVKKPNIKQIKKTLKKFNLKKPFILTVGKLEPRKNLNRLIKAFYQLNNQNIDLVIAGPEGWDKIIQQSNNLTINNRNIKLLGYISDNELYSLYSSCLFFVFPSFWEGFGYPVIEAMKLGVPVATSNTSSLKEIVEDAALLFNPFDINEITQSMHKLISDKKLRQKLSTKGKQRSKIFTWENYYNYFIKSLKNY